MARLSTLAVLVGIAAPCQATDLIVTRYDDPFPNGCSPGDCSLREATIDANAGPGSFRIVLSAGTYELSRFGFDDDGTEGDLDLVGTMEIVGPGATMSRIDGTELGTAFPEQIIEVFGTVTLRGITVERGVEGGIRVSGGDLTLEECEVRDNAFQQSSAAGVEVNGGGQATIRNSAIINNGTGLIAIGTDVVIENTTFHSNNINQVFVDGGADVSCTHCTVVDDGVGNPEVRVIDSQMTFKSSIVDGKCELAGSGVVVSAGANVESPGHTCSFTGTDDIDDVVDSGVSGAPDYFGGPTRTFALGIDTPPVNRVDNANCGVRDQRGVLRVPAPFRPCDSGAHEQVLAHVPTPLFADGFEQGDAEAWSSAVGL